MKHDYLKSLLALVVTVFLPFVAGAVDFLMDGVAYNILTDSTVMVVSSNNAAYSGDVVIPTTVTNQGVTYTVTQINSYAFEERQNLNSVTLPPTIKKMGHNAFIDCNNMSAVYISDLEAWMNIDFPYSGNPLFCAHHLYLNNVEVRELVIPESVTTLKPYIFHGCHSFRSLVIPSHVTDISYSAFYMCDGLTSIQVEEGNTVFDSRDNCNAVIKTSECSLLIGCENTVIPSTVTAIGGAAFSGRTGLTSVVLHNGITLIGGYAFEGCTNLTEVNLPVYTTTIGSAAFRGSGITQMIVPNTVKSIGTLAFMDCANLTNIQLSNKLTILENAVFKNCTSLLDIEIPPLVERIVNSCFMGCSSLRSISFGNSSSLKKIEGFAFAECSSLTSVVLPHTLQLLDQASFADCTSLNEVQFNGRNLTIKHFAFEHCDSLKELYIPYCVNVIKPLAFAYLPNMTSVVVAPNNWIYDSRDSCNAIIETESNTLIAGFSISKIPNTVTTIDTCAFYAVKGLSGLVIPESVKTICKGAFEYSDITELNLPGVETLDDFVFSHCDNLTSLVLGKNIRSIGKLPLNCCSAMRSLTCMATVPPVLSADICESIVYNYGTLYVPVGSVEAYKAADYWKKFKNIVGVPDVIPGDADGNGVITMSDVTNLIDVLLSGDPDALNNPAYDVNGDGKVSITDVTALIDILLNS